MSSRHSPIRLLLFLGRAGQGYRHESHETGLGAEAERRIADHRCVRWERVQNRLSLCFFLYFSPPSAVLDSSLSLSLSSDRLRRHSFTPIVLTNLLPAVVPIVMIDNDRRMNLHHLLGLPNVRHEAMDILIHGWDPTVPKLGDMVEHLARKRWNPKHLVRQGFGSSSPSEDGVASIPPAERTQEEEMKKNCEAEIVQKTQIRPRRVILLGWFDPLFRLFCPLLKCFMPRVGISLDCRDAPLWGFESDSHRSLPFCGVCGGDGVSALLLGRHPSDSHTGGPGTECGCESVLVRGESAVMFRGRRVWTAPVANPGIMDRFPSLPHDVLVHDRFCRSLLLSRRRRNSRTGRG